MVTYKYKGRPPHAGEGELVERGDPLQVGEHAEGQVAEQAGGHVGRRPRARPLPVHQPRERRDDLGERPQRLQGWRTVTKRFVMGFQVCAMPQDDPGEWPQRPALWTVCNEVTGLWRRDVGSVAAG